jgi:cysteine synthase A
MNKICHHDDHLYAKVESFNPLSSAKDRVALSMIEEAEKRGDLKKGSIIVEPTSGNTGIGLAFVSAVKGYHCILVMPDSMSIERRKLASALGAEVVLTPGNKGMSGAIAKALSFAQEDERYFVAGQFENKDNPLAHYRTTGPEIWKDMEGDIDFFVATVGTGGTISGTAKFLKEQNPAIRIVAVEPQTSAVLEGKVAGKHGIQGIGAGFIPQNYESSLVDSIIAVSDEDAMEMARRSAKEEGILVGISSGAALCAAIQVCEENKGKRVVVLLPDSGERYLSTPGFYQ